MRRIAINLPEPAPSPKALMLLPRPFGHWNMDCVSVALSGVECVQEIKAENSQQRAFIAFPSNGAAPEICFEFEEDDSGAPEWVWEVQENRYTAPSADLTALATDLTRDAATETEKLCCLTGHAAEIFGYGHVEERFNDGQEDVPAICGTARGSCVDINTFLLAGGRAVGLKGQYIAGYWFHPEKIRTDDMHCWLAFETDGELQFWDVAHHLKWGVNGFGAGLNPAGGRRVAMSCGRGLEFETPNGAVSISHFSEPVWVLPGGETIEPRLQAVIEYEDN